MKRAAETLIKEYLRYFPCVALMGPRQCGKTTLVKTLTPHWTLIDLEKGSDLDQVSRDPDLFFRLHPDRLAIDEAQLWPPLFRAMRVAVDSHREKKGRFVITGSSSPHLSHSISESLAGRVGIIEMAPFSCAEAFHQKNSSFFDLFNDKLSIDSFQRKFSLQRTLPQIHEYWWNGGYPELWLHRKNKRFTDSWFQHYIETYLLRDISRLFPSLNQHRFRTFIQLLTGLSGTIINFSDVARALAVSQPTVRDYFNIAHGSFLWRSIPAFEKSSLKRLVKHPKGYLRDTGLLHHLLKIASPQDLLIHPKMGMSWEGLVMEEIFRGLLGRGIAFESSYYRTSAGAEVDLVLDGKFGLIPIEIKYTQKVHHSDLKNLSEFIKAFHCPIGLVINNGEKVQFLDEKIVSFPFGFL